MDKSGCSTLPAWSNNYKKQIIFSSKLLAFTDYTEPYGGLDNKGSDFITVTEFNTLMRWFMRNGTE